MPAKFTSGQYKQMAEIFRDMKPTPVCRGDLETIPTVYWKEHVRNFCQGLCKLDPKVKPHLFYRAAGLDEET